MSIIIKTMVSKYQRMLKFLTRSDENMDEHHKHNLKF